MVPNLPRTIQLRLYFSSFSYVLMQSLRRLAFKDSRHEKAHCLMVQEKLFNVSAIVRITARWVWL
ncbi:MAG: hypothetical protein F4082_03535 [Gammaproteobacteria bacterium]|nr:hypothetical protein [Gammaproteobacteria bacterium]